MFDWATTILILAQNGGGNGGGGLGACGSPGLWMPLIIIFALFYFMILAPQKREQAKRKQYLDALKKNDRVVTIGGIIGTIVSLSSDGREVTLKVDEGARIKMLRSAIQGPLREEDIDARIEEARSEQQAESR